MFRRHRKPVKAKKRSKQSSLRPETVILMKQITGGVFSILFVVLLVWGVWHVTRLPALTVSTIEVSGGYTISHDEVRTKVASAMVGEYAKLIPKTFTFLLPKQAILASVSSIDKLKDPVFERQSLQSIKVTIDEYIPHALWCEEREGGHCYYVDEAGVAFSTAPPLTGSAFLRYRTLGRTPAQFDTLTDNEQLVVVAELVKEFEQQFNFPVLAVELDVVGDTFFILRGGSEIKVSKRLSAEETVSNLEAVLSAPEFQALQPGDFPYIDLRFGNKVFVSDEWPVAEILVEEEDISDQNITSIIVSTESPSVTEVPIPEVETEEEGDIETDEAVSEPMLGEDSSSEESMATTTEESETVETDV